MLSSGGLINSLLLELHLIDVAKPLLFYNRSADIVTLVYSWIPFVALPIFAALNRINLSLLEAAFLMCFTTSFDEFVLSFFLIGNETTLPIYLYSQLRFPSRLPLVVTLAAIIMVASIGIVLFSEWLRRFGRTAKPSRAAELAKVPGE